jgi:hypothetical protein
MITSLFDAWRANRKTIGGKQPASRSKIILMYSIEGMVALILYIFTPSPSSDFLVGSITAFAILAGFSFSSLLFFVDHDFSVVVDQNSREQAALQKNITALGDQLFANIHYFNLCSLVAIAACLIGLSAPVAGSLFDAHPWVPIITEGLGRWILFLISFEAFISFFRILKRIRYLFGKVREAHNRKLAGR